MVPWPNRIDGGRWMLDGSVQQLEITDREFYSALHGLLTSTDYLVDDQSASSVTLSAPIRNAIGYPFELVTSVRYSLTETGVGVRHRITNQGTRSAPVAIGTHPYLRVGDAEPISLAVRVPAGLIATLDDRHLPLGWESMAGTTLERDDTTASLYVTSGLAWSLLATLASDRLRGRPATADRIHIVQDYLRQNLASQTTVGELARLADMSTSHFSALFKASAGLGVVEYVKRLRSARACELLITTRASIADVARSVGYQDAFYFSRQFHTINGMSPREFRARSWRDVL